MIASPYNHSDLCATLPPLAFKNAAGRYETKVFCGSADGSRNSGFRGITILGA